MTPMQERYPKQQRGLFVVFAVTLLITITVALVEPAHANRKPVILVLGDSLSAGYGFDIQAAWPSLLQQRLNQQNQDYQVINASISGDTTGGGLSRLPSLLERYAPTLTILELGANDGLRGFPLKIMRENLQQMIELSRTNGSQILLLGMRIPPNYGKRYADLFHTTYADLAKQYNVPWVEFFLEPVVLSDELMQEDRLHPTADAQPIILNFIWPEIEALLTPQQDAGAHPIEPSTE